MSDNTTGGYYHTVESGETVPGIAFRNGLFWQTIWEHAKNDKLREEREDPNVLKPGDDLFIPEKEKKVEKCITCQRHTFKRKGVPSVLRVQVLAPTKPPTKSKEEREQEEKTLIDALMQGGDLDTVLRELSDSDNTTPPPQPEPWSGVAYEVDIEGTFESGEADENGVISITVPPDSTQGVLWIARGEPDERILSLTLGSLAPIKTERGRWQRLSNLGFPCGEKLADFTDLSERAFRSFQSVYELDVTGKADDATVNKLLEVHGR